MPSTPNDIPLAVGDGARRMTYAELAQARSISLASARRLAAAIVGLGKSVTTALSASLSPWDRWKVALGQHQEKPEILPRKLA
jgi:hypothetical protein